jgi:hypothetical protein
MIAYARQHGYGAFAAYRERWNGLRRNYLRDLKISAKTSRPYRTTPLRPFAEQQGVREEPAGPAGNYYGDFYEEDEEDYEDDERPIPDISWLYYH